MLVPVINVEDWPEDVEAMIYKFLSRENPKHCWHDIQDEVEGGMNFKPEVSGLADL